MICNVFWALNASGEINFKYTSAKQKLFMYVCKKQKYVYNKEPTTLHNNPVCETHLAKFLPINNKITVTFLFLCLTHYCAKDAFCVIF